MMTSSRQIKPLFALAELLPVTCNPVLSGVLESIVADVALSTRAHQGSTGVSQASGNMFHKTAVSR